MFFWNVLREQSASLHNSSIEVDRNCCFFPFAGELCPAGEKRYEDGNSHPANLILPC